jgi:hypothetical protein
MAGGDAAVPPVRARDSQIGDVLADRGHRQVGGKGFNGPSHFSFEVDGDRGSRMTIRA